MRRRGLCYGLTGRGSGSGERDLTDNRGIEPDREAWVLATASAVLAYAVTLVRDRDVAEELVQDCYCRLLKKADVYDLARDGRRLLFRSVTNACINHATRARPAASLDGTGAADGLHDVLADRRAEPAERVLMRRELEDAIAESLGSLPVTQRAALELKSLGQSLDDIGLALGVSANHAGVLVHRARQAMARRLAPHLEETSS
jgi:RNA polymerase sigma-70 factor (ECF subfamily)